MGVGVANYLSTHSCGEANAKYLQLLLFFLPSFFFPDRVSH